MIREENKIRREIECQLDLLQGNMNRMQITKENEEVCDMHRIALGRILTVGNLLFNLFNEQIKRLNDETNLSK